MRYLGYSRHQPLKPTRTKRSVGLLDAAAEHEKNEKNRLELEGEVSENTRLEVEVDINGRNCVEVNAVEGGNSSSSLMSEERELSFDSSEELLSV
jgi:metal-responsive CopG/Arc/MetJ family transcriptional regulator